MKIDFNKRLQGVEKLEDFLGEKELHSYRNGSYKHYSYKLAKLAISSVNALEENFNKGGFKVTRSASNALWISEPNPFSLELEVQAPPHNEHFPSVSTYPDVVEYSELPADDLLVTKKEEREVVEVAEKKFFGIKTRIRREVVYRVIPIVDFFGTVKYEKLGGMDPKPVLDILISLDYHSHVTPTSEQVIKLLGKLREKTKVTKSGSSSSKSRDSDDCLEENVAAFLFGAALF